jgi:hypothetical protein
MACHFRIVLQPTVSWTAPPTYLPLENAINVKWAGLWCKGFTYPFTLSIHTEQLHSGVVNASRITLAWLVQLFCLPIPSRSLRAGVRGPCTPHTHTHTLACMHTSVPPRTWPPSRPPARTCTFTHTHTHTQTGARARGLSPARPLIDPHACTWGCTHAHKCDRQALSHLSLSLSLSLSVCLSVCLRVYVGGRISAVPPLWAA